MFRENIPSTPFSNQMVANLFENICLEGGTESGDATFISTLRALLYSRIKKDEQFVLFMRDFTWQQGEAGRKAANEYLNFRSRHSTDPEPEKVSVLAVFNIRDTKSDDKDCVNDFKSGFLKRFENSTWHEIPKVSAFFQKVMSVACIINPETKTSILFTSGLTTSKMHYLQCGIFAFMPWFLNGQEDVSPIEMELVNSLRSKAADEYKSVLSGMCEEYGIRDKAVEKALTGFESSYERSQITQYERQHDRLVDSYDSLLHRLQETLTEMRDVDLALSGLRMAVSENKNSEIMKYLRGKMPKKIYAKARGRFLRSNRGGM